MKKLISLLLITILLISLSGCIFGGEVQEKNAFHGSLRISSYTPDTLNPLLTENNANLRMLKLVFEPLIICDEEQRPVTVLADSYSVSEDGLTWTVNLKQNVTWHDGTPFTVADVEYTYGLVHENLLPKPVVTDEEKNVTEYIPTPSNNRYRENLDNVDTMSHLSDYTLVFTLKEPQANFINLLNIPIIKNTEDFKPVGTGPYKYAYKKNKSLILKVNESWWDEKLPTISTVEVKLLPDKDTSVYAFVSSEIDIAVPKMSEHSSYAGYADVETLSFPSGKFNFIYFNKDNQYLKTKEIRQAVVMAVNKRRINDEVLSGHGNVTDSIFNPSWWMYDASAAEEYQYNVKNAVEKVQNYIDAKNRMKLRLLINEGSDIRLNVSGIIRECLSEAGIDVEIDILPWEEYLLAIEEKNYDMYLGEINYSAEINPRYVLGGDEKYKPFTDDLQKQITEEGKKKAYYRLQKIVAEDVPLVPLYFDAETIVYNKRIGGNIRPLRDDVFYNINYWNLDGFDAEKN